VEDEEEEEDLWDPKGPDEEVEEARKKPLRGGKVRKGGREGEEEEGREGESPSVSSACMRQRGRDLARRSNREE